MLRLLVGIHCYYAFFCEAYGGTSGEWRDLGVIEDIRLKELFDIYFNKKTDQIRRFLRHKNADVVSWFLLNLAEYMYNITSASIPIRDVRDTIGYVDTSSQDSVYLRLLDEDIIIEEKPADDVFSRNVQFVYEEFMEYVLSRAFIIKYAKMDEGELRNAFTLLMKKIDEWVNSRGVVEYILLALLGSKIGREVDYGFALLEVLISGGGLWMNVFWSVVGKLPEEALNVRLFDFFRKALEGTGNRSKGGVRYAVINMQKYSKHGAKKLASILLWSVLLPNKIRWSDIASLEAMNRIELEKLGKRLQDAYDREIHAENIDVFGHDQVLEWVMPCVDGERARSLKESIKTRGKPRKKDFQGLMFLVRELFPEHQAYLLNGIYHSDLRVAKYCADRIRFVKEGRTAVAFLCGKLATIEGRESVKGLLKRSEEWILTNNTGNDSNVIK